MKTARASRTVILAPERAYELDPIGLIVLRAIDGATRLADLCARLAQQYSAPLDIITRDVTALLQGLADKRLLRDGTDEFAAPPPSAFAASIAPFAGGPAGLLAELTHRCPLQCPYCSNPLELERSNAELTADEWGETFRQAASIGALQLHLSGGEPTVRRDLEEILAHAVDAGLYTNLVTSAVLLTRERLQRLAEIGLDHVQVSIQDVVPESADRISGYQGGVAKKRDVARWTREFGMGLTINAPMHRQNIAHLPQIIDFAVEVDAQRIEIAHIQYYAWAQMNRAALIPTREAFMETVGIVDEAKKRLAGVLNFDFVIHDHYATRPKACTGGWGRSIIAVTPSGKALPCHAAQTLPGLTFDNVRERPLGRHLAERRSLQRLPRHGLDEGALPFLRAPRNRFRRLPLSGVRDRRRRRGDRPRLPPLAGPCALCRLRGSRIARLGAGLYLSPLWRRRGVNGARQGAGVIYR